MPGGNKKVTQTYTNMQLLFKYVWPFCYHKALKGLIYFQFWKKEAMHKKKFSVLKN